MSPNSPNQNSQSKRQPTELMKDYLWDNAKKITAERNAEKLKNLEKENFKSAYIAKYQTAISETQNRFDDESKFCDEIYKLIAPTLQEIVDFAKQHSMFPPEIDRTPDLLPIQFFKEVTTPSIKSNLDIYYSSTDETIVSEYQNKTAWLLQKHVHLTCGINWGWITGKADEGEFYGNVYGIQLSISHLGEIKLGEVSFGVPELSNKEFKKALSEAFFSPVEIQSYYRNPSLSKKVTSKQESKMPIAKRWIIYIVTFFRSVKKFWVLIWSEPQFEIDEKASFLKKLWYGFPTNNKSDDESS